MKVTHLMVIGTGSLWLFLLLVALSVVTSVWPRWLSPLFGGIGLFLGIFLVASVVFQWSLPYRFLGLGIYGVFFVAVIFFVSGVIGGLVLLSRPGAGA